MTETKIRRAILRTLVLVSLAGVSAMAVAKSWYVGKEGADDPDCGARTSPCLSITHVLNFLAGNNDKIIVGPGKYLENLDISIEGLKLESVAGRWGTIIEAASPADHVIYLDAPKIQIGKKGKGFTVQGATDMLRGGIFVNEAVMVDRIKIEGNRVTENFYGIVIINVEGAGNTDEERAAFQSRPQLRFNDIVANTSGVGIVCEGCGGGIIHDNRIDGNPGTAGWPLFVDFGDRVTVMRNVIAKNGYHVAVEESVRDARIKDNVISASGDDGVVIFNADGHQIQSNIFSQNGDEMTEFGLVVYQETNHKPMQVKHNLAVAGAGSSFFLAGEGYEASFEGNTSVGAGNDGVDVDSELMTFKKFRNNTTVGSVDCGIYAESDGIVTHEKHYFANNTLDTCGGDIGSDGSMPKKPGPIKVNKAKAL